MEQMSGKVPRKIHQIWIQGKHQVPKKYRKMAETWKSQNPDWQYHLWDDNSLKLFLQRYHTDLLHVYCEGTDLAFQADIGRYAILDVLGGIYADMDTICVRPIDHMLCSKEASLYIQLYDNPVLFVKSKIPGKLLVRVANSVIASVPRHPIWQDVFERIIKNEDPDAYWLERTGPPMFSSCVKRCIDKVPDEVRLLDRQNILTAFYLPIYYMRWYGMTHRNVCVLDFNDSGRRAIWMILRSLLWPVKAKTREKDPDS